MTNKKRLALGETLRQKIIVFNQNFGQLSFFKLLSTGFLI